MKNIGMAALLIVISATLYSCKKDDTTSNPSNLEGTYKLKEVKATGTTRASDGSGYNTLTRFDYTSVNSTGTIVIDNAKVTATDVGYSINSNFTSYIYNGTALVDSLSFPVSMTLPGTNTVSEYQLIGSDSIYFKQGFSFTNADPTTPVATTPAGGRYTLNGSELTLSAHLNRDTVAVSSGQTVTLHQEAISVSVWEKQ